MLRRASAQASPWPQARQRNPLGQRSSEQVVPTGLVGAETADERRQVLWQIVRQHVKTSRPARLPPFYCTATIDQPKPDARRERKTINIMHLCEMRIANSIVPCYDMNVRLPNRREVTSYEMVAH